MSIEETILFVSTFSEKCRPCIETVKQHSLDIKIVRLDNSNIRQIVQKNKNISINVVPTLLVVYEGGNANIYQGVDKIMEWMSSLMSLSFEEDEKDFIDISNARQEDKRNDVCENDVVCKRKKRHKKTTKKQESEKNEENEVKAEVNPLKESYDNLNRKNNNIMQVAEEMRRQANLSGESGIAGGPIMRNYR